MIYRGINPTEAISIVIAKEELPVPIHRERSNQFAFYYHRTDCFGLANSLLKDTKHSILAMTFRIDRHCEGGTTEAISIVIAKEERLKQSLSSLRRRND